MFNDFGSTEACGSAYFEWSAFDPKPDCVGVESLHSRIVFLDDDDSVLEHTDRAHPGIIATEGGTLMTGYLNAPDLTAEVFRDGRVLSSDLGWRGSDGMVYFLGRRDNIIVSGANKISPVEIEDVVSRIAEVKECACVGVPDEIMGQVPVLFVVWDREPLPIDRLTAELEKRVDRFKIPRPENIHVIDALPRTAGTGKVIKRKLAERLIADEDV